MILMCCFKSISVCVIVSGVQIFFVFSWEGNSVNTMGGFLEEHEQ